MKRKEISLTVLFLLLLTSSCLQGLLCIRGEGNFSQEYRNPGNFTGISNSTSIDVIYKKADTTGVLVEAEENLLYYIVTEVNGNSLTIRTRQHSGCLFFNEKPLITVTSPLINNIISSGSGNMFVQELTGENVDILSTGSGDINCESIEANDFSVKLSGSGNINCNEISGLYSKTVITGSGDLSLNGICNNADMTVTGSGSIYGITYMLATADITISGSGNIYTSISDRLTASLTGSGDIYLRGDPEIHSNYTGSGRIIYYKIAQ